MRPARRRAHLDQGRRDARRPHRGARVPLPVRQRRLYAAFELRRGQMRRAPAGAVYGPECLGRRLLRLHQPRAGDRHARLRRHRGRFRHRVPDGQARPPCRHGPDGVPHPQRLPRRRHEGAPARGEELRADRMRAGRGREGELADPRRVQAHVVAQRRRRRARGRSRHAARPAPPPARPPRRSSSARPTTAALRRRPSRCARRLPRRPRPHAAGAASSHGATRFSSVFGRRR